MASKDLDTRVVDPSREFVESESELKVEVQMLKQQMILTATDITPQPFHTLPTKITSYPAPLATHALVAPPPATFPRSSNEIVFKVPDAQHYAPEPTFKVSDPFSHTPHFEPPGETEKHAKTVEQDEISRKVKILDQSLRNIQGIGSQMSVSYKDLCLFHDVQLPARFKMPKVDLYDRHRDPVAHLRGYCSKMRGAGGKDKLLMAYFSQSLSRASLEWYTRQDVNKWYIWDDMAQVFSRHFQYNIEIVSDRMSLTKMEKKPSESFKEYGLRWREKAARVNPPMEEKEMVEYFLQAQEPTYFGHLISVVGKPFNDVVKIGEMVEDGLKSSKIMSYSALKATTQAIQNNTRSLLGQKEHDDVAMVLSGSGHGSTGPPHQYTQPQPQPQTYPQAPHNPPQYYPPNNVRSFVQPLGYSIWRAPALHNALLPSQHFEHLTTLENRGNEGNKGKEIVSRQSGSPTQACLKS
ncbi:uncharacterized protein [Nicotiana sylvestris]|uniref:uncharacterized protein n=1 Tax=Nicotiana sylvestris TaxID=4096 RepID=UPI00388C57B6